MTQDERREYNRLRMRRVRAARRQAGLCYECNSPAEPGKGRCEKHLQKAREWWLTRNDVD